MGSPEQMSGFQDRDIDDDVEVNIDIGREDCSDADDSSKHRSSTYRKLGTGKEDYDGLDRYVNRKRVSPSSRGDSDRDDYDTRKESRSKQLKKNAENPLDELTASYEDVEAEYETNVEKVSDGDLRYSERWDNERDTVSSVYSGRGRRRRWDEPDDTHKTGKRGEESDVRSGRSSDLGHETTPERERSDMENESRSDIGAKFREEMQMGSERAKREETWKRRPEKEIIRETENAYDNMRDWELPRRGRDGRSGGRKDGSRTEAVKTSSKYGISRESYDVIEIQTKPFDHGKEESRSGFPRHGDVNLMSEARPSSEPEGRSQSAHGEGSKDGAFVPTTHDQQLWRDDDDDYQISARGSGGPFNPQGVRGNRVGRVGRGRPLGRDGQQPGISVPLVGSPFRPLGVPPSGPMQSLPSNMSPAPGPTITPGVFIPPFQPPLVWPGARGGIDMSMLGVPPGLPPVPLGPRFPPNQATGGVVFSPPGHGRGILPGMMAPNFNAVVPVRPQSQDKISGGGWVPPRPNAPPGKAPSRGEQNDYSQNFVDTGMRPQNYIRELELTSVVEDYPKLRELIQKKDEIVAKSASPPMYYKCDLREQALAPEFFGTKFDVILVDPPWEEYVHRAPGVTDHMEYWTFEEIMNLKIEAIADTPSFIFLWVGDGVGLEQGRQCLKKWGFRRCEDICWVKTNKTNATPGLRHDSHTLFQRSKEHCLMGIKGTVRRSTDGHIIHANIDTDVIIAEEPPYGSTAKPEDMYRIIEHFALGRRRLELFGEDHNIRTGWLTVGKGLSSSNFNEEAYIRNFADKDGNVWAGGGGRNPPPEAPHLVLTTPEIEALRPKSPMKNQQQSASISLTTGNSSNRRPSPQNANIGNNQEASSSNIASSPAPWEVFKGRDGHIINVPPTSDEHLHNRMFVDVYGGYNPQFGPAGGDFSDYESHRGMNNML